MTLKYISMFLDLCRLAGVVPFLWGQKGIGKSESVLQWAISRNLQFVDLRLGQVEEGDLVGLPRVRERNKRHVTIYAQPEWFPDLSDKTLFQENGVVFLDEFNRAATQGVLQAMFQFILGYDKGDYVERKLHTHVLPKGWNVIAAGNPDTSDYMVQALDSSMLNRFVQVAIKKDHRSVIKWTRENLSRDISDFIATSKDTIGKHERFTLNVSLEPRNYTLLHKVLKHMDDDQYDKLGLEVIQGCLGEEVGMAYFNFRKENLVKPIPAKEILGAKNFEELYESKLKPLLDSKDGKKRTELINISGEEIISIIERRELKEVETSNFIKFLNVIPPDISLNIMKETLKQKNCITILDELTKEENNPFIDKLIVTMNYDLSEVNKVIREMEEILDKENKVKTVEETTKRK